MACHTCAPCQLHIYAKDYISTYVVCCSNPLRLRQLHMVVPVYCFPVHYFAFAMFLTLTYHLSLFTFCLMHSPLPTSPHIPSYYYLCIISFSCIFLLSSLCFVMVISETHQWFIFFSLYFFSWIIPESQLISVKGLKLSPYNPCSLIFFQFGPFFLNIYFFKSFVMLENRVILSGYMLLFQAVLLILPT